MPPSKTKLFEALSEIEGRSIRAEIEAIVNGEGMYDGQIPSCFKKIDIEEVEERLSAENNIFEEDL